MLRLNGCAVLILGISILLFLSSSSISSISISSEDVEASSDEERGGEGDGAVSQNGNENGQQGGGEEVDSEQQQQQEQQEQGGEGTDQEIAAQDVLQGQQQQQPPTEGDQTPICLSDILNPETGKCDGEAQQVDVPDEVCDNQLDDDFDGTIDMADSDCLQEGAQDTADSILAAPAPSVEQSQDWGLTQDENPVSPEDDLSGIPSFDQSQPGPQPQPPSDSSSIPSFSPLEDPNSDASPVTELPSQEVGMGSDTFQNMGPDPMAPSPSPAPPFDPMSAAPPPQPGDTDPLKLCETSAGRALLADPAICDSLGIVPLDQPPPVELCNDGLDNDGDTQIDTDDPDCQQQAAPLPPSSTEPAAEPQDNPPIEEPPIEEPPIEEPPIEEPPIEEPPIEEPQLLPISNQAPVAVAKLDTASGHNILRPGEDFTLDGTDSYDNDGDAISYLWSEVSRNSLNTYDLRVDKAKLLAPEIKEPTRLTFSLVVDDGQAKSNPSKVDVNICPALRVPSLSAVSYNEPEIDPSTSTGCNYSKVDVRSTTARGVGGHLYIIFTDRDGDELVYRGGPSEPPPFFGDVIVGNGYNVAERYDKNLIKQQQSGANPIDYDPAADSVTVLKGKAADGKDKCFDSVAERINAAKINYEWPEGPNSNTVVRALLVKCGIPLDKPVGNCICPGWSSREILDAIPGPIPAG